MTITITAVSYASVVYTISTAFTSSTFNSQPFSVQLGYLADPARNQTIGQEDQIIQAAGNDSPVYRRQMQASRVSLHELVKMLYSDVWQYHTARRA